MRKTHCILQKSDQIATASLCYDPPGEVPRMDKGARTSIPLVLYALILSASCTVGCHSITRPKDPNSVSVTLKRTACEGTCPVYTVSIHGSGQVEYLGEWQVDVPGLQTGSIPPEKVKELLEDFEQIHFYGLQNKYFEDCTDLPTAIISISVDGKAKEVSNYYGGCQRAKSGPQVDLATLADRIDNAAGAKRWVKCDPYCLKGLIQTGLNANARAPDGDTPLIVAVRQRDLAKTRLLLDAGAQVNVADSQRYTPLMYAVMANNPELVQELLGHGADVYAKDKRGFSVLQMAGGQKVRRELTKAKIPRRATRKPKIRATTTLSTNTYTQNSMPESRGKRDA